MCGLRLEQEFFFDLKGWLLLPGVLTAAEIEAIKAHLYDGGDGFHGPAQALLDHPAVVEVLNDTLSEREPAEEYYNYGIALLNARNVPEARGALEKALEMAPGSDHVHYALALAMALSGDLNGAYENLKRSIELEPRNRQAARQDPDFGGVINQPPFNMLLQNDKKTW